MEWLLSSCWNKHPPLGRVEHHLLPALADRYRTEQFLQAVVGRDLVEEVEDVALIVAANIIWSGVHIVRKSVLGLMDTALPLNEVAMVQKVLDNPIQKEVQYHALRTRQSGSRRFVSVHVLVPGKWTVQRGHELLERIEADIRQVLPSITVFTHLESLNDPASWDDITLDRDDHI